MNPQSIEPEFVALIPSELTEGTLYVSMVYATTVHLCACGCRGRVVLPLSPAEWQLFFNGESISLKPSVGNWEFICRSHYWIKGNEIQWATRWTDEQIAAGRRRDADDLAAHFSVRRTTIETVEEKSSQDEPRRGTLRKVGRWFKRRVGRRR